MIPLYHQPPLAWGRTTCSEQISSTLLCSHKTKPLSSQDAKLWAHSSTSSFPWLLTACFTPMSGTGWSCSPERSNPAWNDESHCKIKETNSSASCEKEKKPDYSRDWFEGNGLPKVRNILPLHLNCDQNRNSNKLQAEWNNKTKVFAHTLQLPFILSRLRVLLTPFLQVKISACPCSEHNTTTRTGRAQHFNLLFSIALQKISGLKYTEPWKYRA